MPGDAVDAVTAESIVEEASGDLFDAPENAVLTHSCNCLGSWGAGIAKVFMTKYPFAYQIHRDYCEGTPNDAIIGKCQLIPPQKEDYERASSGCRRHWIACLFTSIGYGKPTKKHPGVDRPDVILSNTRESLKDLKVQLGKLEDMHNRGVDGDRPGELWCCKFNSELFAVDWAETKKVLEEELKGLGKTVRVVSPARS